MYHTASYDQFQTAKHIPNLDGLRGISILLVMLHHIPVVSTHFLQKLQQNGRLGVALFFAISGFLITQLALRELKSTGSFNIKNFYIRRSLRLFPLYYTVLAVVCILVCVANVYPADTRKHFAEKLPSYLFYYSNLTGPISGPFSLLWSLAVEEQFYLFFSLAFLFFPKTVSFSIFVILTALQFTMSLWTPYFDDNATLLRLIGLPGPIFLGVLFAYLFESVSFYNFFSRYFGNRFALTIVITIVAFYLMTNPSARFPIPDWMFNTSITLLVVICAICPPLFILGGPIMSYIGKISYGIYLIHTIVFYGIKGFVSSNSLVVFLIGGLLTIAIASLSYEYYEKYFLNLKKRFI